VLFCDYGIVPFDPDSTVLLCRSSTVLFVLQHLRAVRFADDFRQNDSDVTVLLWQVRWTLIPVRHDLEVKLMAWCRAPHRMKTSHLP